MRPELYNTRDEASHSQCDYRGTVLFFRPRVIGHPFKTSFSFAESFTTAKSFFFRMHLTAIFRESPKPRHRAVRKNSSLLIKSKKGLSDGAFDAIASLPSISPTFKVLLLRNRSCKNCTYSLAVRFFCFMTYKIRCCLEGIYMDPRFVSSRILSFQYASWLTCSCHSWTA